MEYKLKTSIINGLLSFISANGLDEVDRAELESMDEKELSSSAVEMLSAFNSDLEPRPITKHKDDGEYEINTSRPLWDDDERPVSLGELLSEYEGYYFLVNIYKGIGRYIPTERGVMDIHGVMDLMHTIGDDEQVHMVMPTQRHNDQIYVRRRKGHEQ